MSVLTVDRVGEFESYFAPTQLIAYGSVMSVPEGQPSVPDIIQDGDPALAEALDRLAVARLAFAETRVEPGVDAAAVAKRKEEYALAFVTCPFEEVHAEAPHHSAEPEVMKRQAAVLASELALVSNLIRDLREAQTWSHGDELPVATSSPIYGAPEVLGRLRAYDEFVRDPKLFPNPTLALRVERCRLTLGVLAGVHRPL